MFYVYYLSLVQIVGQGRQGSLEAINSQQGERKREERERERKREREASLSHNASLQTCDPHCGAEIQPPLQDSCRECAVQLLPECHADSEVRGRSLCCNQAKLLLTD